MRFAKLAATAALAVSSIVASAGIASAQPVELQQKGMNGSYVGAGVSAGVTNGGQQEDAATFGGNSTALIPMVTLDAPVAKNTNVYLGGGYSFQTDEGKASQLGNKNAPVVTLGAESEVARNTVIYGDAKWGIDAYKNSSADAVSLQAGVGYRF